MSGRCVACESWFKFVEKCVEESERNGIFLENGVHDEKGEVVVIDFPITIIGESKDGSTIIGGLKMTGKKEDDVNVKTLTISQSKGQGVIPFVSFEYREEWRGWCICE